MKDKNHVIISIDVKKAFHKIKSTDYIVITKYLRGFIVAVTWLSIKTNKRT